jgi:DNA-binding response OmpR family regulator
MEELLARVDLQLKKTADLQEDMLRYGDLKLDLKSGMLSSTKTADSIPVSGKEYALLEYFLQHPLQILTRDQIYSKVWGWDNNIESNTLEAYLTFIRKKLKLLGSNVEIKSVRGLGYRIGEKNA